MTATVLLLLALIAFALRAAGIPALWGVDLIALGLTLGTAAALAVRIGLP